MFNSLIRKSVALVLAMGVCPVLAAQEAETQKLEEVRNTVINLLQALVQRGLISQEQAQQMVANAQQQAQSDAAARTQVEQSERDSVRVTYVPQIVRDEIGKQVAEQVKADVVQGVVQQAKTEGWGIPGALPDWISRVSFSGDVRVRTQANLFADDNVANSYLDYQAINSAGGILAAGPEAFRNLTEDRYYSRLRLRFGLEAQLASGFEAGFRLASGSLTDPVSTNQTLGKTGSRYQIALDRAYLRYDSGEGKDFSWLTFVAGRFANPYVSTDLVFDPDLQFDGISTTFRVPFGSGRDAPNAFATVGAMPLQEVELSNKDKWLYGAQLGLDLPFGNGLRWSLAGAYYYYDNTVGIRNAIPDDTTRDYTAPQWLQSGNTVYPIAVDSSNSIRLYGLAADYHVLDINTTFDIPFFGHVVSLAADYVSNVGYDQADVLRRSGFSSLDAVPTPEGKLAFDEMTEGYGAEVGFGTARTGLRGNWRLGVGYRYLERDAVLDAFTDSDFRLGGTGSKGYFLRGDWWFTNRSWLSFRYITADEISHTGSFYTDSLGTTFLPSDTPRFGVDSLLLDLNGQF